MPEPVRLDEDDALNGDVLSSDSPGKGVTTDKGGGGAAMTRLMIWMVKMEMPRICISSTNDEYSNR